MMFYCSVTVFTIAMLENVIILPDNLEAKLYYNYSPNQFQELGLARQTSLARWK